MYSKMTRDQYITGFCTCEQQFSDLFGTVFRFFEGPAD